MNIIKKTNYLSGGTIVAIKNIKDWDYVGVVIHPASISEEVIVKGWVISAPEHHSLPIVRTAARYYRLSPNEELEVLYEPADMKEFKPKETQLYPIDKPSDY